MKIYVNVKLDAPAFQLLASGTRGHEISWGTPIKSIISSGATDSLDGFEVAFGQPDPRVLAQAPALRFVQLSSAGWARYDVEAVKAPLRARGTVMCNASSVFAAPVAEHAIAMMLALTRRLPQALDEQRERRGWPMDGLRAHARVLRGERVLLLGYGAIAQAMADRLRPFGCELVGYRRRVRGDEPIRVVDDAGLDAEWARADHVVDLLPEGEETHGFIDAARLARGKRGARLYNLGRGTTVDRDALAHALGDGTLDAAYLDVTSPEPLPPDDPLWQLPNLFVTPHVGGGHVGELSSLVRHFLANLAAFERGAPLVDRVV